MTLGLDPLADGIGRKHDNFWWTQSLADVEVHIPVPKVCVHNVASSIIGKICRGRIIDMMMSGDMTVCTFEAEHEGFTNGTQQ